MAIHRHEIDGVIPEVGPAPSANAIQGRVDDIDWTRVHGDLDAQGWAMVPQLLTPVSGDR